MLSSYFHSLPKNVRGIIWIIVSCLMFSLMGATVKSLGEQDLNSFQIVFFRLLAQLIAIFPIIHRIGMVKVFTTDRPGLHIFRSLSGVAAMSCVFYGYTQLTLVDVTTITYAKVLFITALAPFLLGEVFGWRRVSATVAGFLGVVIMLRPGGEAINWAAAIVVFGTFCMSAAHITIKKLTSTERAITILAYFSVIAFMVSIIPAWYVWQPVGALTLVKLFAMGIFGLLGQFFVIRGYRVGEASAVVPANYISLVFAFLLGFVLFDEIPDQWSILGGSIIIASTLYISWREIIKKRKVLLAMRQYRQQ